MIDKLKIKNALLSVFNKEGLLELCKELKKFKINLYSTGGTYEYLKSNDIDVKSISEITELPSLLDGRVKTLHPFIHSAILADKNSEKHLKELESLGIQPFDLVVINFYPFEEAVRNPNATEGELVEKIDIGGPTMVRSSAKNFGSVCVLSDKSQYQAFIKELNENAGLISLSTRRKLACFAFQRICEYDSAISNHFNNDDVFNCNFVKAARLRYGENPHQQAAIFGSFFKYFELIHGKELSYNNILDIISAVELLEDFESNACVIVKHNNACGVALASSSLEAFQKAFSCDTKSAFGGIVAFNSKIDLKTAEKLNDIFLEVVIIPELDDNILNELRKKKDRRIIIYKEKVLTNEKLVRSIPGGLLVQDKDNLTLDETKLEFVTNRKPTAEELDDLKFAWVVAKHIKSNAIVYAKNRMTIGIGAGQMSRVDSSKIAEMKAKEFGHDTNGCVVASDAFFPFADGLESAVSIGATAVIQPGGSIRDKEVIEFANKNNLAMVFTHIRHFKH